MDTSSNTPTQDKQVTIAVPADRVPEFYAFFARFLAAGEFGGRGRRGRRGPGGRGHGEHRHGGHGRCGNRTDEQATETQAQPATQAHDDAPVTDAPAS